MHLDVTNLVDLLVSLSLSLQKIDLKFVLYKLF